MQRNERLHPRPARPLPALLLAAGVVLAAGAHAQPAPGDAPATLRQAFAAAWARQPEARSLAARRDAAEARRQAADAWLAEPPALELSGKTDRVTGNDGGREYEIGVALPLWLPGERARAGALADAEARAAASRAEAARLRTAAAVREAWWDWQRARGEKALAEDRLASARALAEDVARRVRAGDLARADRHQADGAVAGAEAALAEAAAGLGATAQRLRALTGRPPLADGAAVAETLPGLPAGPDVLDAAHPVLDELRDRAEVARRGADLAGAQTRANPELTLLATRERGAFGESWGQALTVGVRIPFGAEPRHRAKAGLAHAEAIEAEELLRLEGERLAAERDAARQRVDAAAAQLAAAETRARLAAETRGFFDKSFRLGESDLPTRLRVELEAAEAGRQAGRARIDHAAAVSALRQALGLLPE
ncbi:MAG: TolC family protein [Rhodocyclaceae bacterium]|nr:TolC family protein [Rhodocyclaceae bacterium]